MNNCPSCNRKFVWGNPIDRASIEVEHDATAIVAWGKCPYCKSDIEFRFTVTELVSYE